MNVNNILFLLPIIIAVLYFLYVAYSRVSEEEEVAPFRGASYANIALRSNRPGIIRRNLGKLIFIALCLMPLWFKYAASVVAPPDTKRLWQNYDVYQARCTYVYDGDTIRVTQIRPAAEGFVMHLIPINKFGNSSKISRLMKFEKAESNITLNQEEKVRYLGFNSPDPDGVRDPDTEEFRELSRKATLKNVELVRGKDILLLIRKTEPLRDTYSRLLAYPYAPTTSGTMSGYIGVSQELLNRDLGDTRYGSPDSGLPNYFGWGN